ncbi:MAG TPA: hypothetical protein PLS53_01915 [Thermoanaerobaculaceae bacterium]|nr:hypothetical protein [Thermoanaerobaculaceae bacterium]HPS76892.1 hypothetical protein [Thermoanaerobaculaceae bacterium]
MGELPALVGGRRGDGAALAMWTVGEASGQQPQAPGPASSVTPNKWVDRWYERITHFFNRTVQSVDNFFAQYDPVEPQEESQLRVGLFLDHDRWHTQGDPLVSAEVQMPNLERRMRLYVQNISETVLPSTAPEREKGLTFGSRGDLFRGGRFIFTHNLGVRFSGNVSLFAQVAGYYRWYWGHWDGIASQSVFWTRNDHIGSLSRVVLDRKLHSSVYLRLQSALKHTQTEDVWRTSQVGRVAWIVREKEQYLIGSVAMLGKGRLVDEYRTDLTYRARFWRPWIFAEVTPFLSWERDRGFQRNPGFRIGLDLFFGGVPRL